MVACYSSNILLDVLIYYSSCTYDDWYDLYLLVSIVSGTQSGDLHTCSSSLWPSSGCCSHLEWPHLRFGTYQTSSLVWWLCLGLWHGNMSVSDDWGVPQDSCLLICHHLFRLMLIPALCFHFDAIVPAYVQMQLGSYLVVLLRYWSAASVWHPDMMCSTVSGWVWHILHLSVVPCLIDVFAVVSGVQCLILCCCDESFSFSFESSVLSSIWMIVLHPYDPSPGSWGTFHALAFSFHLSLTILLKTSLHLSSSCLAFQVAVLPWSLLMSSVVPASVRYFSASLGTEWRALEFWCQEDAWG